MNNRISYNLMLIAALALLVTGCGRDEQPPAAVEAPKASVRSADDMVPPSEYMRDKEFRAKVDNSIKERNHLYAIRERIGNKMEAFAKGKTPAELESSAEWQAMLKTFKEAEANIEAQAARTREIVRKRIRISK